MNSSNKNIKDVYENDVNATAKVMESTNNYYIQNGIKRNLCVICDSNYGKTTYRNKSVCSKCLNSIKSM